MKNRLLHFKSVFGELIVVGGGSLLALLWLIPNYTSEDPFTALQPGFLPSVCASVILFLLIIETFSAARKKNSVNEKKSASTDPKVSCRHALSAMVIVIASVLAFYIGGLLLTAVTLIPSLMLILGERCFSRILIVTCCCGVPFTPLFS